MNDVDVETQESVTGMDKHVTKTDRATRAHQNTWIRTAKEQHQQYFSWRLLLGK